MRRRIPLIDESGLDLVSQLLKISPCERVVAKHLLNHPWFDDVRGEIKRRFQSWCVGFEKSYEIMVAVDRLPPAQKLSGISNRVELERRKETESKESKAATTGKQQPTHERRNSCHYLCRTEN